MLVCFILNCFAITVLGAEFCILLILLDNLARLPINVASTNLPCNNNETKIHLLFYLGDLQFQFQFQFQVFCLICFKLETMEF